MTINRKPVVIPWVNKTGHDCIEVVQFPLQNNNHLRQDILSCEGSSHAGVTASRYYLSLKTRLIHYQLQVVVYSYVIDLPL